MKRINELKRIMILGAGTYQVPLIKTARRMGLYTIVVSIPGDYLGFSLADKVYYLDTRDREGILKAAREEKIDGICTSGTDVAVSSIGYVCEQMGLTGIPLKAAETVTDKALMKEAFLAGGVAAAKGVRAYTLEEARRAAERIGYPVVVKRVDSSGSRGISVVRKPSKIEEAFLHAKDRSSRDYVLVEEYLKGVEIGVDGFVQDGKLVFLAAHDKFIYQGDNITVPVGHAFPYRCSKAVEEEIARQMQRAVTATEINCCSVNADVFVDGGNVYIIEIGGRTGATCIPELISICYGFDFYEKMIRSALGEKVDFSCEGKTPCMAKLLMSPLEGTLTGVNFEGIETICREEAQVALDYPVGHHVYAMTDGTDRIGHVIMEAEKEEELDRIIRKVRKYIAIDHRTLEEIWNG